MWGTVSRYPLYLHLRFSEGGGCHSYQGATSCKILAFSPSQSNYSLSSTVFNENK